MEPIWRPIPDFEGLYEVSSDGRIRSVGRRIGAVVGRIMKPHSDRDGYQRVELRKDHQRIVVRIHRVVAKVFIGECPRDKQVDHVDGIKTNNDYSNLEYVTSIENLRRATVLGLKAKGERNGASHLTKSEIILVRTLSTQGIEGKEISAMTGISTSHVSSIINRKAWKHV